MFGFLELGLAGAAASEVATDANARRPVVVDLRDVGAAVVARSSERERSVGFMVGGGGL